MFLDKFSEAFEKKSSGHVELAKAALKNTLEGAERVKNKLKVLDDLMQDMSPKTSEKKS